MRKKPVKVIQQVRWWNNRVSKSDMQELVLALSLLVAVIVITVGAYYVLR